MPIYVVECSDGCRYVGKSANVPRRVAEHGGGGASCAAWVRAHGGVARELPTETPPRDNDNAWEHAETLFQMRAHGFERVRGAAWTRCASLSATERAVILSAIVEDADLCRGCGMPGHFISECPGAPRAPWLLALEAEDRTPGANGDACRRCSRAGHVEAECLEITHARGHCLRCGRNSHTEQRCYARTHRDGGAPCKPVAMSDFAEEYRRELADLRREVGELADLLREVGELREAARSAAALPQRKRWLRCLEP